MPDNPARRGKADRTRISLLQAHELAGWPKRLKCTPRELVLAVALVRERLGRESVSRVKTELAWADRVATVVRREARQRSAARRR